MNPNGLNRLYVRILDCINLKVYLFLIKNNIHTGFIKYPI